MKKIFLLIFSLLLLTSCGKVELNPEWYPRGLWKDDIFVSSPNGKFNISKLVSGNILSVFTDGGNEDILHRVTDYKRSGDKVYVYADDGYCIIDENSNTAEIFLTFSNYPHTISDPAITYLKSFDDFPDKAKKIFADMEEYWSDKDYRRYGSHDRIYPDGTIVYSKLWKFRTLGPFYAVYILILAAMIFFLRRPPKENKSKKK